MIKVKVSYFVLVFLLLTLNIFYTFFYTLVFLLLTLNKQMLAGMILRMQNSLDLSIIPTKNYLWLKNKWDPRYYKKLKSSTISPLEIETWCRYF